MLALVTIFITTFLVAVAAVWLYRLVFGWKGFDHTLNGRPRMTIKMKLNAQQGYITLVPSSRKTSQKPVRLMTLYTGRGGLKAPWGW